MKRKNEDDSSIAHLEPSTKKHEVESDVKKNFRKDLFEQQTLDHYTQDYRASSPYKHGVISDLIEPELLRSVRNEIRDNINFTPKETDIYKIHQSGDLANLDGLDDESLKLLPSLVLLRDTMYSQPFRHYLASLTGSGPLSGKKTDMAVNVYTPGGHLLCHDDVIGSRRVSYILYLTDPETPWQSEWGGALRLYPTEAKTEKTGALSQKVPSPDHCVSIPPAFNQISFFAVQPGESFHDVEEVYDDDRGEAYDGGRVRMAISGWYHIPQEGEEGFEEGVEEAQAAKSSLTQLQGKADEFDLPKMVWTNDEDHDTIKPSLDEESEDELSVDDLNFLLKFMNPRYLTPDTVAELSSTFADDSFIQLALFLSDRFSNSLKTQIKDLESKPVMPHPDSNWSVARPPHKHRYLFLNPETTDNRNEMLDSDPIAVLNSIYLPSVAFKKWLSLVTGLELTSHTTLARCFRRGKDYTLATSYDDPNPRVELCLGMTPSDGWGADEPLEDQARSGATETPTNGEGPSNGTDTAQTETSLGAERVGGYETYMAGDEDEAINAPHTADSPTAINKHASLSHTGAGERRKASKSNHDPAVYRSVPGDVNGEAQGEDDGVLFSMPASWNALSIVLRDRGTLKFVKYVSRMAKGNRWDVIGYWNVDEDEEGEGDDAMSGEEEAS